MPTVTELRKAGNLNEALIQGKAELTAKPADLWAKRNLAWVYYELLKGGVPNTHEPVQQHLQSLAELALGGDEELLYTQVMWQVVKRIYALGKAAHPMGAWSQVNHTDGLTWRRSALSATDAQYRYLTEPHQLLALIEALPCPRPSEAHSALLKAVAHLKEKISPLPFLLTYGPGFLRPEDFKREEFQGRQQPALAEQVYMGIARELSTPIPTRPADESIRLAQIAAFLPQLAQAATAYPTFRWLPYYLAKLQLRVGDVAAALPTLLPVVRQNSSEFWAWQLLSETLAASDPAASRACLYRATTCGAEQKFLRRLRLQLADQLKTEHPGEARWQLLQAEEITKAEGWPVKGEMFMLQLQLAAYAPKPAEAARRAWLALADQTTYGDLPWEPVVLQFISEETAEKPVQARLLPAGPAARAFVVPLKRYSWLKSRALGTPLQVRAERIADRLKVVQLQERPAGQCWDVLPTHVAVLTGVTADHALAFFTVRPGFSGMLRPAEFDLANLTVGDVLQLRIHTRTTKAGETKHYVLAAEPTTETPDLRVCRPFSGPLKVLDAGFGFVDNIFLPAALIVERGCQPQQPISGVAVLQHNKRRQRDEWNVIRLD